MSVHEVAVAVVRRLGRRLGTVLVVLVAAATLAGCSAARNSLGTEDAGCYITLPRAVQAVHGAGHLAGVRLEAVASLRRRAPKLYAVANERGVRPQRVCLVAFHGRFKATQVERASGAPVGRLAVVVLEYPDSRLLGTVLFFRAPVHFGHTHLGAD